MPARFHFFAGKGGVGKTTCAVAFARAAARRPRRHGRETLVISTDPAHSLGDLLGVRLTSRPRRVEPGLTAVELDAPRAFARWLGTHRRLLTDLLERGTWLDRADVTALLDLTIPGVDELAGLIEIGALSDGPYSRVVVDTAPTGHTLRLLSAPATVAVVASVLDALQQDFRMIRERFARTIRRDAADRLIDMLAAQSAEVAALLRDRVRTAFHWVMLPEPLAVAESEDGLAALDRAGFRVAEIVVNRVWPNGPRCALCDRRRAAETAVLERFHRERVRLVVDRTAPARRPKGTKAKAAAKPGEDARADVVASASLVFVGGKGGVGKTTVAAAIALRIARSHPEASVLLLSTDPAHSLGDVFGATIGDDERRIPGGPSNLFGRELDAARALAERRSAFERALDQVGGSLGAASEPARRLLDLAPPGVDELFGMLSVLDARARHRFIVVDMAPTGHALRLLEMPDMAREWIRTLLRVLLKYKAVVRPGGLGEELVAASRSIRTLQATLRDPASTRFLVVTRAEPAARMESERLLRRLRRLEIRVPAVIVNARTLQPQCRLCRGAANAELREVAILRRSRRGTRRAGCAIIQTPLAVPPPRGADAIVDWGGAWLL